MERKGQAGAFVFIFIKIIIAVFVFTIVLALMANWLGWDIPLLRIFPK